MKNNLFLYLTKVVHDFSPFVRCNKIGNRFDKIVLTFFDAEWKKIIQSIPLVKCFIKGFGFLILQCHRNPSLQWISNSVLLNI